MDGEPELIIVSQHFNALKELFPKANCNTLMRKCKELGTDEEAFGSFLNEMLDDPTPLLEKSEDEGNGIYDGLFVLPPPAVTKVFDVELFLKQLRTRDPFKYFDEMIKTETHKRQTFEYLKNRFRLYSDDDIERVMKEKNYNVLHILNEFNNNPPTPMIMERLEEDIYTNLSSCTNFINEIKFVENFEAIHQFLALSQDMRQAAKLEGETFLCECCEDDEVLRDEVMTCTEGHVFCEECIQKYVGVSLGESKFNFACLSDCVGTIPLNFIKEVISTSAYLKLCAKIQEEEVKKANIAGIEFCPHCEYAAIPEKDDALFVCKRCNLRICRLCRKEEHTPLKCGENLEEYRRKIQRIDKDESASKVVLRKCKNCHKSYIKESGCNVISCPCGTIMCYVCSDIIQLPDPHNHRCHQL